jgi:osmotically-inducible protein OsmY
MRLVRVAFIAAAVLSIAGSLAAQQRSDSQIRADAVTRIKPDTRAGDNLTITVEKGVVTISGTVVNLPREQSSLVFARRTVGVREVVDKITVIPTQRRTDEEISRSVAQALKGNLGRDEREATRVRVDKGIVMLTGTLTSSYPKQVAGLVSSFVPGVVGVRNEIVVRPREPKSDPEILADIRDRYRKNAFVGDQKIDVSVSSGTATLAGTVDTFLQAEQAEAVARFAPGVVDVRNDLYVREAPK